MFRKLSPPIPSAELDVLGRVRTPQEIPDCVKLDSSDQVSDHFTSSPLEHLHVIVELPPASEYPRHLSTLPVLLIDSSSFLPYQQSDIPLGLLKSSLNWRDVSTRDSIN
jgi:hypothetical protein